MIVYHCTNTKAWSRIKRQGLRPGRRGHICVSEDPDYAKLNGMACFEPQADALVKKSKYTESWDTCFKKAIGRKRRVLIKIDLPREKLLPRSLATKERVERVCEERGYEEILIPELHVVTVPPRYFVSAEVVV